MDLFNYAWLKASEYRQKILLAVSDKPKTPKEIREETGYYLSHVSTTLSELKTHKLVDCLTPERHKGRLYIATERGKKLAKEL